MTRKLVIGIHGLANKPEEQVLRDAWHDSIIEGLNNVNHTSVDFDFDMVYWADLLYAYPLHRRTGFEFDPLFNTEPYVPAKDGELREYSETLLDQLRIAGGDLVGESVEGLKKHFGFNRLADLVLRHLLKDLSFYYSGEKIKRPDSDEFASARRVLRDELKSKLQKHAGRDIMLIAHSMGSIIAYDTLRELGPDSGIEVSHFVTIGSPLGLPHVQGKILNEAKELGKPEEVRTPSIVTKAWLNFADKRDPVAADPKLADDYTANGSGVQAVQVIDDLVANTYHIEIDGKDETNHHKSYGYLRTPEFSKALAAFLQ